MVSAFLPGLCYEFDHEPGETIRLVKIPECPFLFSANELTELALFFSTDP